MLLINCSNQEKNCYKILNDIKKDNDDFQCPKCEEVFRTIAIFNKMLKDNK